MRHILLIARNDLRLFLREKSGYFWLFGSPLLFAFFMGFANRGPGSPASPNASIVIEDHDGQFLARALKEELGSKGVTIKTNSTGTERRLVIPERFTENVLAKKPIKLEWIRSKDSGEDAAPMIELRLARALVALNSYLLENSATGLAPTESAIAELRAKSNPVFLKASFGTRKQIPSGYSQAVPGILVMFTMMNLLIFGGATLAGERRDGMLRRLLAQPLSLRELVLGKIGGLILLGAAQIAFLLLAAKFLMRLNFAGNLGLVILTMGVYAWVAAALGVLIGSIISREDKIIAVCVLASMAMAALGGCWWPLEIVPENVRLAGHVFPSAWAMDALLQVLSFGGGLTNILRSLVVLSLFGLGATVAAVRCFRM
jgi:ABC-2 type transport system permease protein